MRFRRSGGRLAAPICKAFLARCQLAKAKVRPAGIEPAACGLKDRCSLAPRREPLTTELRARDVEDSSGAQRLRAVAREARWLPVLGLEMALRAPLYGRRPKGSGR